MENHNSREDVYDIARDMDVWAEKMDPFDYPDAIDALRGADPIVSIVEDLLAGDGEIHVRWLLDRVNDPVAGFRERGEAAHLLARLLTWLADMTDDEEGPN